MPGRPPVSKEVPSGATSRYVEQRTVSPERQRMDSFKLIQSIRSGCEVQTSEERLYCNVRAELLPRLHRRIPARVRSRLDMEDVLHETFLRAMGALDFFRGQSEASFYGWVYRIAVNLIGDQCKRRSVEALRLDAGREQDGPRGSRIQARQHRPETQMQRRDLIEVNLSRLKRREAEVIRLHRLDGLSFAEIGKRWNRTEGAVQRYFSRAWKRFCSLVQAGEE